MSIGRLQVQFKPNVSPLALSFPKRAKRDLKEKCEGKLNRNLGKKTDKLHAWDWYIFVFEGGRIEFWEKNGGCAKYGYICISNR